MYIVNRYTDADDYRMNMLSSIQTSLDVDQTLSVECNKCYQEDNSDPTEATNF